MRLKRKTEAPLSPLAQNALLRFKGPTAIPPHGRLPEEEGRFLSCHRPVCALTQKTGREGDRTPSLPTVHPQHYNVFAHTAATWCSVND